MAGTIFGLEPEEQPPDDWTPLEAVAVLKCLDETGKERLYVTCTNTLNAHDAVGMLISASDVMRDSVRKSFTEDE
jgi:hypothetical protein